MRSAEGRSGRAYPGDEVPSSLGLSHITEEMCEIYQCWPSLLRSLWRMLSQDAAAAAALSQGAGVLSPHRAFELYL